MRIIIIRNRKALPPSLATIGELNMPTVRSLRLLVLVIASLTVFAARADDEPTFHLVLKDHQFHPSNITVPAHTRVKLIVENQQDLPAEFESFPLNREKVVTAHNKIVVYLSPMDPGTYTFFDDFHRQTKGTVTAK